MIRIAIPGRSAYELEHLALDMNGTIAVDGQLLPGVAERLAMLASDLRIHLLTANTHGGADAVAEILGAQLHYIQPGNEAGQKQVLVQQLGVHRTVAIGNGANDVHMLLHAAIGIAVLGPEGLAGAALQAADIVAQRIEDALDLLLRPNRLTATLRR